MEEEQKTAFGTHTYNTENILIDVMNKFSFGKLILSLMYEFPCLATVGDLD